MNYIKLCFQYHQSSIPVQRLFPRGCPLPMQVNPCCSPREIAGSGSPLSFSCNFSFPSFLFCSCTSFPFASSVLLSYFLSSAVLPTSSLSVSFILVTSSGSLLSFILSPLRIPSCSLLSLISPPNPVPPF